MADPQQYKEIIITVSDVEIKVKSIIDVKIVEVPIDYYKDKTKLQSSVARALQRVLRSYKFGVSPDKIFDNEDYLLLGQLLFEILIGKTVRNVIKSLLLDAIDYEKKTLKQRCRIYLQFAPQIDEELALLPWEYLFAEFELEGIEPLFLAADLEGQFDLIRRTKDKIIQLKPLENGDQCSFIRAEDNTIIFSEDSAKKILIIFVVVALDKLPTDKLKDFKDYLKSKNFIVKEITNPTLATFGDELDDILTKEKNNTCSFIIHYYGHAKVEDNCGQVSFMNQTGDDHEWIPDTRFADLFQASSRRPHLMVLQACSSGQIVKYTDYEKRGIALLLSLKEIPAVVAMQNDVSVWDSSAFVEIFYADILKGSDVAEAVTKGRQYLGSKNLEKTSQTKYSTNAFGAPILFISTQAPIRLIKKFEITSLPGENAEKKDSNPEKTEITKAQNEPRKPSENILEEKAGGSKENTDKDLTKPEKAGLEINASN